MSLPGLARSTVAIHLAKAWEVGSRVVLTPVVIGTIGLSGYGTWTLLFGLCSYVVGINASLGVAYNKLTAELDRPHDEAHLREVLGTGMTLATVGGALVLTLLWLLRAWLLPVLGVENSLYSAAERTLFVLLIGMVVHGGLSWTLHMLGGLQRVDLQHGATLFGSVLDFCTALALLHAGVGLVALPLGFLVGEIAAGSAGWVLCRRLRPGVRPAPWYSSRRGLRRLASLGIRFQGLVFVGMVTRQAIRLLLSALCGTAALGMFHLADRLLYVARTPAVAVTTPLVPAFASLASAGERERWSALFARASKVLALAGLVPLLFGALFADTVLYAWTGQHYPEAAWTARVLAPAEFVVLLTGVATGSLRAAGTVRLELTMGVLSAALILAGITVGYPLAGYAGIVVAVAVGRLTGGLWFLRSATRLLPSALRAAARANLVWPALVLIPVVLVVASAGAAVPVLRAGDGGRVMVLGVLLLLAAACVLASALTAWCFVLSPAERAMLRRLRPTRPQG